MASVFQFVGDMGQNSGSLHSPDAGDYFAFALGFGLCSLAVFARVYTKMRPTKTMRKEDCKSSSLIDYTTLVVSS